MYSAPEVLLASVVGTESDGGASGGLVTPNVDVWSLGCILLQLLIPW